ncbi:MAG: right-handed parallel beta-helix repeat-containing protein, partial [Acidimicrobiia bacterium]|nr:right-handed parallel beta-helix repeat-containing protein [Acidimicrobiia bacterium]
MSDRAASIRVQSVLLVFLMVATLLAAPPPAGAQEGPAFDVDNRGGCSDEGGAPYCTIQAAVDAALGERVTITVAPGIYPESVTIGAGMTLVGAGANQTLIDGRDSVGAAVVEVSGDATIRDIAVAGGPDLGEVGGIRVPSPIEGSADVLLDTVWVHDNAGLGVDVSGSSTVRIVDSTVGPNNGQGGVSASVYQGPSYGVAISNTTISGNGGSGLIADSGDVLIDFVTITGNGTGVAVGVEGNPRIHLRNSVVANNATDCAASPPIISEGNNVIGVDNSPSCAAWLESDQVGPSPDMEGTLVDAKLGPLADNGGTTLTHWLLPGSPALGRVGASISDFLSSPYQLNSSASTSFPEFGPSSVVLTPSELYQVGSAFRSEPVRPDRNFTMDFTFSITGSAGGGADGLTFVIADSPTSLGDVGGGLGIGNLTDSVAVEFDTWNNGLPDYGDPNENHMGIDLS